MISFCILNEKYKVCCKIRAPKFTQAMDTVSLNPDLPIIKKNQFIIFIKKLWFLNQCILYLTCSCRKKLRKKYYDFIRFDPAKRIVIIIMNLSHYLSFNF